jgi:hypothetical protein
MNHIETNNFELYYKGNYNKEINIEQELFRGELYCYLLKQFTKSCLQNLNEKVFSHKKIIQEL